MARLASEKQHKYAIENTVALPDNASKFLDVRGSKLQFLRVLRFVSFSFSCLSYVQSITVGLVSFLAFLSTDGIERCLI